MNRHDMLKSAGGMVLATAVPVKADAEIPAIGDTAVWLEYFFLSDAARFQIGPTPPVRLPRHRRWLTEAIITPPRYDPCRCGLSYGVWAESTSP